MGVAPIRSLANNKHFIELEVYKLGVRGAGASTLRVQGEGSISLVPPRLHRRGLDGHSVNLSVLLPASRASPKGAFP